MRYMVVIQYRLLTDNTKMISGHLSGAATMVNPMMRSLTPMSSARIIALTTANLPPITNAARPPMIYIHIFPDGICLCEDCGAGICDFLVYVIFAYPYYYFTIEAFNENGVSAKTEIIFAE